MSALQSTNYSPQPESSRKNNLSQTPASSKDIVHARNIWTFPQEAEELFVATERNAKLRYEGYKKLSEM